jgi:tetratricopeptide (TPR) repeat protein
MYEPNVQNQETDMQSSNPEDARAESQARAGWRVWLLRIGGAVLIPIVVLLAVEVGLRVSGVGYSTELMQPCTIQGHPASCYNLYFPAPFFPPGVIKSPQVYAFPAEKAPGTFRIVVLGESAAMGDPDPAYGFSRYLEIMLRQRFPEMRFEVANTGSVAINSHVSLLIAKGLLKQKADVAIIYSGNNEVVGPYGPGTALTSSGMNLAVIRASIFLRSTRIGQLLSRIGAQKQEWRGMEMFLDKQVPANSSLMPYAYSNFETNLRDTVHAARDAGATVIISTVATNLKDCAPFASQHRDGLSQEDLSKWSALVQQGSAYETEHAYDEALNAYFAAQKVDDQYAELEFRIARTLMKKGDNEAARRHFHRARDLDTLRFRADSRINEINRLVGTSSGQVSLVDTEAIFDQHSPNGVVGSELIYEHVHLTPEGNYLLARSMFPIIASQIAGRPIPESEAPTEAECERLLALTAYDRQLLFTDMLSRLQRPPFTSQLNHADQVLRLTIDAGGPPESPDQTVSQYQWAISKAPEDRILHSKFGLFLFNYDRGAGAEQLMLSRPWDGFPVFTPDGMQL